MSGAWKRFFAKGGAEAVWIAVLVILLVLPLGGILAWNAHRVETHWLPALARIDSVTPIERNGKVGFLQLHLLFVTQDGRQAQAMVQVLPAPPRAVGQTLRIRHAPDQPGEVALDGAGGSAGGGAIVAAGILLLLAAGFALRGWIAAQTPEPVGRRPEAR